MPTVCPSSHPWTECSTLPSDGSMLSDGSMCGTVELVAGQISGGWEIAMDTTARARAMAEMQATTMAALVGITAADIRRSCRRVVLLSLIHISEPTRLGMMSYAGF